jgi:hypothetical protein
MTYGCRNQTVDIGRLVSGDGIDCGKTRVNFYPDLLFTSSPGNVAGKQKTRIIS